MQFDNSSIPCANAERIECRYVGRVDAEEIRAKCARSDSARSTHTEFAVQIGRVDVGAVALNPIRESPIACADTFAVDVDLSGGRAEREAITYAMLPIRFAA